LDGPALAGVETSEFAYYAELPVDWRVLVFTMVVSMICGVAFG